MIPLNGFVQNYSWGKFEKASQVALLCENKDGFTINDTTPYAELWMGTHSKGPTKILGSGQLLSDWLYENSSFVGEKLYPAIKNHGQTTKSLQLPFLFKVLSVNEALSIQVHPTKQQAKFLHTKDAKNYPDENHKPEMAIALTPFEMLCGFRPVQEILAFLEETPELKTLISDQSFVDFKSSAYSSDVYKLKRALKACFSDLMHQTKSSVETSLTRLAERYSKLPNDKQPVELLQRLQKAFPGDVGCFAVFFLNYIVLHPGEAVFLDSNEPHAYLYGDCGKCMACSDNTIRAGLTPKFKDVDNLLEMLTYSMKSVHEVKFIPEMVNANLTVYRPPVPEFVVHKVEVTEGTKSYTLNRLDVCSLLICIKGETKMTNSSPSTKSLAKGDIFFISDNEDLFF